MEKKKELPEEYIRLGRYLWDRIDQCPLDDKEAIMVLSGVTYDLGRTIEDEGFMRGLNMWIDVRKDTGEPWDDSGVELKEAYPEFFADLEQTKTPQ